MKNNSNKQSKTTVSFCILIPVLKETNRIVQTINRFMHIIQTRNIDAKICIITTEKEQVEFKQENELLEKELRKANSLNRIKIILKRLWPEYPEKIENDVCINDLKRKLILDVAKRVTTIDVVRELTDKYSDLVLNYHYPYVQGVMAHQLNFGLTEYIKNCNKRNLNLETILFGVFNADSYTGGEVFDWVAKQYDQSKNKNIIFQQYGIYLNNHKDLFSFSFFKKAILLSAGLWQTRWSLGFEIYNALKQFKAKSTFAGYNYNNKQRLNYCIGHGLFFNYQIYKKLSGFSQSTKNEDAVFGLKASFFRIPIIPVPYFEFCDSPVSIKALYIQKSTWFWGPYQAFKYYQQMKKELATTKDKRVFFFLAFFLFTHALRWIIFPLLYVFCLSFVILSFQLKYLLVFLIVYFSYLIIPNALSFFILKDEIHSFDKSLISKRRNLLSSLIIGSFFMFILHGLSVYRTILISLKELVFKINVEKEKTPLR